jgi:hypothetical protein
MASKIVPNKNRKVETSLIEEFVYPKLGPGQLWETAALEVEKMGGEIRKGCRVCRFDTEGADLMMATNSTNLETAFDVVEDIIYSLMEGDIHAPADSEEPAA